MLPRAAIERLIKPRCIALIGSGAWTDAVAAGNAAIGFEGTVLRVHPTRACGDVIYHRSIAELPAAPDAAFVAVPSHEVPGIAQALAARGAGGFVCFSAGFSELPGAGGAQLTRELLASARPLPFFGPNCYGFVNFFDRVAMMPDQIVGGSPARGVALICQSGTLALTLMFNERSLPLGYVFSVGNQSCVTIEDLIEFLCGDPRVSAFGLYIEGIQDAQRFARAVDMARDAAKPIAVIKSGRTATAARAALTHTGAMTGSDEVFDAYCRQAGIARCDTLATLCETLKIFHVGGPLPGCALLMMGTSGGDMAMAADVARALPLSFAAIDSVSAAAIGTSLSGRVTVGNPLDLHTYLWFDPPAMKKVFEEVLKSGHDAQVFMLDCPPADRADTAAFDIIIDAYIEACQGAALPGPPRAALLSSLPETMGAAVRQRCLDGGVVPLQGLRESLEALALAAAVGMRWQADARVALQIPARDGIVARGPHSLGEAAGKAALAGCGVPVPHGHVVAAGDAAQAAERLGFPVVMKAADPNIAHKSDVGAVILDIRTRAEAVAAAAALTRLAPRLLVERMISDAVAEIIVGVSVDPHFGQVLVLGSGGVFTELLGDCVTLLPPWSEAHIHAALQGLAAAKLFAGHRGKPGADVAALVAAVAAIGRYAADHLESIVEIDVNPLIVRPEGAGVVAADALIRVMADEEFIEC